MSGRGQRIEPAVALRAFAPGSPDVPRHKTGPGPPRGEKIIERLHRPDLRRSGRGPRIGSRRRDHQVAAVRQHQDQFHARASGPGRDRVRPTREPLYARAVSHQGLQRRRGAGDPDSLQRLQGQVVLQRRPRAPHRHDRQRYPRLRHRPPTHHTNWDALVQIGHPINERLLPHQLQACECAPDAGTLQSVVLPSTHDGLPAPACASASRAQWRCSPACAPASTYSLG